MPPVIPRLLRENANFRRYFIGQSISLLGDQVSLIALPLTAVLVLHASPAQMGALTTAYLVPNLILSLHAGVWVDRRGRRRQTMLAADLVRALLTLSIPIAYGLGRLTWTHLYVVAFLLGSASVFFQVAFGGFFSSLPALRATRAARPPGFAGSVATRSSALSCSARPR